MCKVLCFRDQSKTLHYIPLTNIAFMKLEKGIIRDYGEGSKTVYCWKVKILYNSYSFTSPFFDSEQEAVSWLKANTITL